MRSITIKQSGEDTMIGNARRTSWILGCLAALAFAAPAGAAEFVMKMGTATQNETQH
jgi:hypothetical protein